MNLPRIFLLFVIGACGLAFSSCANLNNSKVPHAGQVDHCVFIWLKHKGNADDRTRLEEACKDLAQIPGVVSVISGDSLKSRRSIVDSSFDVGVVVRFESAEAMEAYLKNPIHVKLTREVLYPMTKKLEVHDFVVH
jgi:hypothetical protein